MYCEETRGFKQSITVAVVGVRTPGKRGYCAVPAGFPDKSGSNWKRLALPSKSNVFKRLDDFRVIPDYTKI